MLEQTECAVEMVIQYRMALWEDSKSGKCMSGGLMTIHPECVSNKHHQNSEFRTSE